MVDPRAKGATAETKARDLLRQHTKLQWERVPGSGALHERHLLKGDLYLPGKNNTYCVEVKHYAEDSFTSSLFTGKKPQLIEFWEQTIRESGQVGKEPLLIFKHDRSKFFAAYKDMPSVDYRFVFVNVLGHEFYVSTLEDYLIHEVPKFVA